MQTAKALWTRLFDVREGEWAVASSMSLYLMFVMFAYYVLKPVSNALFLNELKVDKLPLLNILIAAAGGLLAYLYSKFAARTSLGTAVAATMAVCAACLFLFWATIQTRQTWLFYAFNIWVSLFGAIIVSQAWVVAGNLFDSRAAKRLYGILGLGAVLGGSFGGVFTAFTARVIGSRNLLIAAAVLLAFAYTFCRLALSRSKQALAASAGGKREDFRMSEVVTPIVRSRHLQLIVAIYSVGLIVSVLSDYQYKSLATRVYKGNELTAFFARVQGIYLPIITIPLQFFLTAPVLRRLGLGGTLAIMPTGVASASMAIIAAPGIGSAVACELAESSARYTVNRTGLELLYLPHPARVRNRVKGFVDVLVDRVARGVGGVLLAGLFAIGMKDVRQVAAVSIGFCALWLLLCAVAQREYVKTIRERLSRRRLDLEESPLNVSDPQVVAMLEQTAETGAPRAARYALSMLAEAPRYKPGALLKRLSSNPSDEVRAKVLEFALDARVEGLEPAALNEVRAATAGRTGAAIEPAVRYVLAFDRDTAGMARTFIAHPNTIVCEAAVRWLREQPSAAAGALTEAWIIESASSPDPVRRRLAALAIGARGDVAPPRIPELVKDSDPKVAAAAFHSAALLADRSLVPIIVDRLVDPDLRREAIEALASFGAEIVGTLGDILQDEKVPYAVRVQIPRVIRRIPKQRSVDVLLQALDHARLPTRGPILQALNKLRAVAPNLNYGPEFVAKHVFAEARRYFELHAIMEPVASHMDAKTATGLLARTLERRAEDTVERVFRLLGLRYPPGEIQTVYRSLRQGMAPEEAGAALELLENTLEHSLRRVVVPLVDSPVRAVEKGRELFDIKPGSPEWALRHLIQSRDPWLVACASAAAAEQNLRALAPDIEAAARNAGDDVTRVAHSAVAALNGLAGARG